MTSSLSRRALIAGAGAFASIAILPRPARAAAYTWRYSSNLAVDHPMNVRMTAAAQQIHDETSGQLTIGIFANSQLGNDTATLSQVRSGAIELLGVAGTTLSTIIPVAAIEGVAFAFKDYAQVWAAMDGDLGKYEDGLVEQAGLHQFHRQFDNGFRQVTTSTRPIKEPGDFKGLKIRVPPAGLVVSLFKGLGASPTPIVAAEMYTALQTHIVDAQENPLVNIETVKLYEVQKYLSITNHMWNGNRLLANGPAWQGLPKNLQEVCERVFAATALAQRSDVEKLNASLGDKLRSQGLTVNTTTPAPFRATLAAAGFYTQWREQFGDKPWTLLEQYVGPLR